MGFEKFRRTDRLLLPGAKVFVDEQGGEAGCGEHRQFRVLVGERDGEGLRGPVSPAILRHVDLAPLSHLADDIFRQGLLAPLREEAQFVHHLREDRPACHLLLDGGKSSRYPDAHGGLDEGFRDALGDNEDGGGGFVLRGNDHDEDSRPEEDEEEGEDDEPFSPSEDLQIVPKVHVGTKRHSISFRRG